MAAKKKTEGKQTIAAIRKELVEAIMDGEGGEFAENTAEKALNDYIRNIDDGLARMMHRDVVILPKERIEVISACLRRCAKDESAAGDKFIESLPGDWGNDHLEKLADDLCSGDLVIEEACEDDLATLADRGFDSRGWRWDTVSLKEKTTWLKPSASTSRVSTRSPSPATASRISKSSWTSGAAGAASPDP